MPGASPGICHLISGLRSLLGPPAAALGAVRINFAEHDGHWFWLGYDGFGFRRGGGRFGNGLVGIHSGDLCRLGHGLLDCFLATAGSFRLFGRSFRDCFDDLFCDRLGNNSLIIVGGFSHRLTTHQLNWLVFSGAAAATTPATTPARALVVGVVACLYGCFDIFCTIGGFLVAFTIGTIA